MKSALHTQHVLLLAGWLAGWLLRPRGVFQTSSAATSKRGARFLLDSHLVLDLRIDLALVAAGAHHATRRGNALDERVAFQHGARVVLSTEVECHWPIRVRATQSAHCIIRNLISDIHTISPLLFLSCIRYIGGTYHMVYTCRFLSEENRTRSATGMPGQITHCV